jgi:hypothetical protein
MNLAPRTSSEYSDHDTGAHPLSIWLWHPYQVEYTLGYDEEDIVSKIRWWLLVPLILILGAAGFLLWAYTPPAPMPQAQAALQSDAQVRVETKNWLAFHSTSQQSDIGLILYPGGRVDPRAYAPAARAIAAKGYLVIIAPMPLNLAVFGANRAAAVITQHPEVKHWVIGGHSLGGAMAARFVHRHPGAVQGLALWASYPATTDDLSTYPLAVASIYGTKDGLSTGDKILTSRPLLPPTTTWVAIEGGNHAQFGWYGVQAGDKPAAISQEAQQDQIVAATLALLGRVKADKP